MSDMAVNLRNSAGQTSKHKLAVMEELLTKVEKFDVELNQYDDVQHLLDEFRLFRSSVQEYRHNLVAHIKNLEAENVAAT